MDAQEIKDWLDEIGEDRQWLADETSTAMGTVNGWLSSGRKIPGPTVKLIHLLMERTRGKAPEITGLTADFVYRMDRARQRLGFESMEEFVNQAIEAAIEATESRDSTSESTAEEE